jgi:tetratricopeptide (TPR) repeat protein
MKMHTQRVAAFWRALHLPFVTYGIAFQATHGAPGEARAWLFQGCAEAQEDRHREAIDSLLVAVRLQQSLAEAWIVLALEYALIGKGEMARDAVHQALTLQSWLAPCGVLVALAIAEYNPVIASDVMESVLDSDGGWQEGVLRLYAWLLGRQGREEDAWMALRLIWETRASEER